MKHLTGLFAVAFSVVVTLNLESCKTETEDEKEERLAKTYCSSCHLFPEPGLLTKETWLSKTLPEMAFRMGLDPSRTRPTSNGIYIEGVIPDQPMVSPEDWELIKKYYSKNAPDSLLLKPQPASLPLGQFAVTEVKVTGELPLFCLVQADVTRHKIYLGSRNSKLYELNENLTLKDSFRIPSPASHLIFEPGQHIFISSMGRMDPNDDTKGRVFMIDEAKHNAKDFLDSLQRPVYFEKHDFNGDHRDDYVICEFGNFTGGLQLYENLRDGRFKKHTLLGLPGARRVVIRDVNQDGMPDLIALFSQGNEQIVLFKNRGHFNFDMQVLLRFPPVYGSSYFDMVDFNGDGQDDILYTNGDNFDFSRILKPYHGVHVFIDQGGLNFKEWWFYSMYGASMAMARDFDGDGDIDIAAISYFPDFSKNPERGFIYFEKVGKKFISHTTPLANEARWLVMDVADIDGDGDDDILLAALDFRMQNRHLFQVWEKKKTGLLVLRNKRFETKLK
jgi:hypothetical protein